MEYVLLLINLISWILYSKYQFIERDNKDPKAENGWHLWGLVNRITVFGFLYLITGFKIALILSLLYFILFDALMNLIALNKPLEYIGTSSEIDILANKVFKGNGIFYILFKIILLLLIGIIVL